MLGSHGKDRGSVKEIVLSSPKEICLEQHVLEADVKRTRGNMDEFRRIEWRKSVFDVLQFFCLKYNIQYKQGMNEVFKKI